MPKNFTAIAKQQQAVERLADEWAAGRVAEAVLDRETEKLQRLCGAPIGSTTVIAAHDRPLEARQKALPLRVTPQGVRMGVGSTKAAQKPQGSTKAAPPAQTAQEQRAARQHYQQRAQQAQARLKAHEQAEARRVRLERAQEVEARANRIAALKERMRAERDQQYLLQLFAFQTRRLQ